MTTNDNEFLAKLAEEFYCECCDYTTSRKYNFKTHIMSDKHKNNANNNKNNGYLAKNNKTYNCDHCGKSFNDRAGIWRHKKKCTKLAKPIVEDEPSDKQLIMMLIKENSELRKEQSGIKELILEIVKNGTHNTTNNTTNTNSHNKAFNLNFFLNETCKNAMNIMDFADSIQLQLSDLENVGKVGYVEGISNIILKNLKALDVTERPVHCADKKREIIYVKDGGKWEKEDDDKKKIKKVIDKVARKNERLLPKYREAHPGCNYADSKYSDQYDKIVIEAMGGMGENETEKEDKIIKNISKAVIIDKTV